METVETFGKKECFEQTNWYFFAIVLLTNLLMAFVNGMLMLIVANSLQKLSSKK